MRAPLRLLLIGLLSLLHGALPAQEIRGGEAGERPVGREREREGPESLERRRQWFYQRRTDEQGRVRGDARFAALQQRERMARDAARQRSAQSDVIRAGQLPAPTAPWVAVGPQPSQPFGVVDRSGGFPEASGRVTALAIDPRNSQVVYLGGAEGGVWKTTDGGILWTPLTDSQPSLAIGSIALAPSNPDIIYAGTGEANFSDSYYGAGVLKSTNGGQTWSRLGSSADFVGPFGSTQSFGDGGAEVGGLAVSPTDPNVVLAAAMKSAAGTMFSGSGIYRSIDGGNNWTLALSASNAVPFSVVFDPTNSSVAYTALGFRAGAGFYRSTDGGASWTFLSAFGLPTSSIGRVTVAISRSNPSILYATIGNPSSGHLSGVFRSTNQGATWTQLTSVSDFCAPQCNYDNIIAVHPQNPNVIYLGGSADNLNNGVGTFLRVTNADTAAVASEISGDNTVWLHSDQHAIAIAQDGSVLYAGNDGGVWSTTNVLAGTVSWTSRNPSLALTQFYPGLALHPTNLNFAVAGTQDNSTQRYSGNLRWEEVNCGDGGMNVLNPQNPLVLYGTCAADGSVWKSVNGGGPGDFDWFPVLSGIDQSDNLDFVPPVAIDPNDPTRVYFGTFRLYQSTPFLGAALSSSSCISPHNCWRTLSADLTNGFPTDADITAIAVSGFDTSGETVFAGTTNGVVSVTHNAVSSGAALATFQSIGGLPGRFVNGLAVSPRNGTAYAVYSGFTFGSSPAGHVFAIANNSTSATDISGNLPNVPVNDVVVDPDFDNTLYVGTDVGVFYTTNGGTTWTPLNNGLPNAVVMGMQIHRATRTLRVVTHGRGMWDLSAPSDTTPSLTSLAPSSATAGGAGFTLTVNGANFVNSPITTVNWNGGTRSTTFLSSAQLTAAITASDIATAGTASVSVTSGGITTGALTFTINAALPAIATLSPSSANLGSGAFTLTVNGTGFVNNATVFWNGSARTTMFVNSTQLTAAITANDMNFAGAFAVTVQNPAGGTSSASTFTVNAGSSPLPAGTVISYLPHVPFGGGYRTKITIVSTAANTGVVNFIDQAGQLVGVQNFTAAAGGTVRVDTGTFPFQQFGPLKVYWAVVGSSAPIGAHLFFEYNPGDANSPVYNVVNTVGFSDTPLVTAFTIPFEQELIQAGAQAGKTVGMAVANPNASNADLTLELIDGSGTIRATDVITITAMGQIIFAFPDVPRFPNITAALNTILATQPNFVGTLTVLSSRPLSVVALQQDYGPFSSLPTLNFRVR
jgi:hypothetical protein